MRALAALCTVLAVALAPSIARSGDAGDPDVAALQVALRAAAAYEGPIDGWRGPETDAALLAFQERKGLDPDGVVGPLTRNALGRLGRPQLASRSLSVGKTGWDVAELQFRLAWHGFPSGPFDGRFGPRLERAVRRFQQFSHLPRIGVAGPRTIAALHGPRPRSPLTLTWPLAAPLGDGFGPRGTAFHTGLDFSAPAGAAVGAARAGRVVWAAPMGSYGNAVVVAHGSGVRTLYAHLAQIDVDLLERVSTGTRLGLVGSTGRSTGPHLHFEVRVRGAAVDPLGALG